MTHRALVLFPLLAVLLAPAAAGAGAGGHYVPRAGDTFAYQDTITVNNGVGNYSGYTDQGNYVGSIDMTAVAPDGSVNATYASSGNYSNNQGVAYPWSEQGSFSFSSSTFLYVRGTDNQTGYTNPLVWFYMNASLGRGASFTLLNSPMSVVSTDAAFATSASSTGWAATLFAEGNGSYQRDDGYGQFLASYNWKAYFDPSTGYVVGYVYSETDSDGAAGDGFTYTDSLTDTHTSFPLTAVQAPPSAASSPAPFPWAEVIAGLVVLIVIVLLIALLLSRRHSRGHRLVQHPTSQAPGGAPPFTPAPIHLAPGEQPMVQQVVVRETVKVPCQFCGTLIDSTATVCPQCGAPRT
jgi:hypothetical protein